MSEYLTLLLLIVPVFLIIGSGYALRSLDWLTPETDASLLKTLVRFFYPCLILNVVLGAEATRSLSEIAFAPMAGFLLIILGLAMGYGCARLLGLKVGSGLRTFCFAVGIPNYGYIPIPVIGGMFGDSEVALLLIHNAGVELAIWTVGVVLLSGATMRSGLRKAANPAALAVVLAVAAKVTGTDVWIPKVAMTAIGMVSTCAIPLGLILTGAALRDVSREGDRLWHTGTVLASLVLRLGAIPLIVLLLARWVPLSVELKRVLAVQCAMPAGVLPIVIARHYGGSPLVAARVVIATTLVSLVTMPFWIRFGISFVGG